MYWFNSDVYILYIYIYTLSLLFIGYVYTLFYLNNKNLDNMKALVYRLVDSISLIGYSYIVFYYSHKKYKDMKKNSIL